MSSIDSPLQLRAMSSLSAWLQRPDVPEPSEEDIHQALLERFPGSSESERQAAYTFGYASRTAATQFATAGDEATLGEVAGLVPGQQVTVSFRTRFGGDEPQEGDEYRSTARTRATAETTLGQLREMAQSALEEAISAQGGRYGTGSPVEGEQEETELTAILPYVTGIGL